MTTGTTTAAFNPGRAIPGLTGVVVIVGAFGSGKTEVALSLAACSREAGARVWIADLDLVNPYFRTREARDPLTRMGIEVVLPPEDLLHADLPILTPLVAGVIRQPEGLVLLDAGGNDVGATVLAALGDAFQSAGSRGRPVRVFWVINPFRPFTDTLSGCRKMRASIERASKLDITGIIGNANLMEETQPADIESGYAFARSVSEDTGLPLEMITVPDPLMGQMDNAAFDCPVLPIRRRLLPPWKSADGHHGSQQPHPGSKKSSTGGKKIPPFHFNDQRSDG